MDSNYVDNELIIFGLIYPWHLTVYGCSSLMKSILSVTIYSVPYFYGTIRKNGHFSMYVQHQNETLFYFLTNPGRNKKCYLNVTTTINTTKHHTKLLRVCANTWCWTYICYVRPTRTSNTEVQNWTKRAGYHSHKSQMFEPL